MPYEDFLAYVEHDPNSHIEVAKHHIDHLVYADEDAYVYKDMGVDYFGDFTHLVDVKSSFGDVSGFVWLLSNDIDDVKGLKDANKTAIGIYAVGLYGIINFLTLYETYGGNDYQDVWEGAMSDTWLYLKIEKSGTNLTCKIYSDAARTNLLKTLSLTLHADHKFRYVFGCNTWHSNEIGSNDNDIENLRGVVVPPKNRILKLGTFGIALEDINISKGDRVILI